MSPDFNSYHDAVEAQDRLEHVFPAGVPRAAVEAQMTALGAELFPIGDRRLNVRLKLGQKNFVQTAWMIRFHFDAEGKLIDFTTKRGFIAP